MNKSMTTPRIDGNEDISDVCLKLGKAVDGKPFINIIEWGAVLREAKANWQAKAHQAGIDEERERICKAYEDYCNHDIDLPEWHKALQNNK